MESEDYHFIPTKTAMGDSIQRVGRIKGSKKKEGLIPVTDSPHTASEDHCLT